MENLKNTFKQLDLKDIYRANYPENTEYTLLFKYTLNILYDILYVSLQKEQKKWRKPMWTTGNHYEK